MKIEGKLVERTSQLVKIYGMQSVLQSLVHVVNSAESKSKKDSPYLRLLTLDLEHSIRNYQKRHEMMSQEIEEVDDE